MDRRKRKTQEAIRIACLELIQEKGFDAMTISNITDLADLNRGTFYLHYKDKYDMIDQFENQFMEAFEEKVMLEINLDKGLEALITSRYAAFVGLFDCFKANEDILQIILQTKGVISLQQRLTTFIKQFFKEPILPVEKINHFLPVEVFQTIIVSIFIGFAQFSIEYPDKYSSEELASGLLNIIVNGPAKAAGFIDGETIDIENFIKT